MPRVHKYFPRSHAIVTKVTAMSADGCKIFGEMMEGMKNDWDEMKYSDVREAIENNKHDITQWLSFSKETERYLQKDQFDQNAWEIATGKNGKKYIKITGELKKRNRVFPDEMEGLRDTDGDGVPDTIDSTYDFLPEKIWRDDYALRYSPPRSGEMLAAPREKVTESIGFVARLFEDDPFLKNFSFRPDLMGNGYPKIILDNREVNDSYSDRVSGGFFVSQRDSEKLLNIEEGDETLEGNDGQVFAEPVIRMSLNLGYADMNLEALRAAILSEIVQYVTSNHPDLAKDVFETEILPEKERNIAGEKDMDLPNISAKEVFEALGADTEQSIQLTNRARTVVTALKYWKRAWKHNAEAITEHGETPALTQEKNGLQRVMERTLRENDFQTPITPDEMAHVLGLSENPHVPFLRLVIKKTTE